MGLLKRCAHAIAARGRIGFGILGHLRDDALDVTRCDGVARDVELVAEQMFDLVIAHALADKIAHEPDGLGVDR